MVVSIGIVMMVVLYSRGSEEGTQASGEERFQGQEEEEVEQNKQYKIIERKKYKRRNMWNKTNIYLLENKTGNQ